MQKDGPHFMETKAIKFLGPGMAENEKKTYDRNKKQTVEIFWPQ